MTALLILAVALVATLAVGLALRSRSGKVRASMPVPTAAVDDERLARLAEAGVGATGRPIVLHFSADWCGPCAAVRRVVGQVLAKLDAGTPDGPAATEIELDIDENPSLAKTLGVLSLPTTFILDGELTERFRISGVPSAADLESALAPLLEPGRPKS
ncbi:thiol-disulfide isomerase/thioredoxin [Rhodococcus sp. LBL1]|uniref:Thiol-disulfide isomerase/thioredoxin n=1 Tax=Prescottella agglutinans TaxID=1644129 RepID=A0ABT6M8X4_9NOCA|nr:thioredoxin family protein [Prescottella agglutinans]MDH6280705.1 thiol-disulfide isomerase/thioredoxin [Prescottella agglutinans]MDH6676607.1 thiol-disulfide isomerase/thioredoxin [Rhodococcus sp. LBL1]MDH6681893.1 thiol-disulfide isomerase/thioredoxin [Rhodococcus sp. LBL2]